MAKIKIMPKLLDKMMGKQQQSIPALPKVKNVKDSKPGTSRPGISPQPTVSDWKKAARSGQQYPKPPKGSK